ESVVRVLGIRLDALSGDPLGRIGLHAHEVVPGGTFEIEVLPRPLQLDELLLATGTGLECTISHAPSDLRGSLRPQDLASGVMGAHEDRSDLRIRGGQLSWSPSRLNSGTGPFLLGSLRRGGGGISHHP